MKQALVIIVLGAMVLPASAQSFTLSMVHQGGDVDATNGAEILIDVVGDADIGTLVFGFSLGSVPGRIP